MPSDDSEESEADSVDGNPVTAEEESGGVLGALVIGALALAALIFGDGQNNAR